MYRNNGMYIYIYMYIIFEYTYNMQINIWIKRWKNEILTTAVSFVTILGDVEDSDGSRCFAIDQIDRFE